MSQGHQTSPPHSRPPHSRPPRGTRDLLGDDLAAFQAIEDAARKVLTAYGYEEVRTPIFEAKELFVRAVGEETDLVGKELYDFRDKKGRDLVLRPEGTAAVVRAYLAAGKTGAGAPTRWWYQGPMFRYERPQAGRYRQFHQIGAELFGAKEPAADVEAIDLARALLEATGLSGEVRVNFLGCADCRPAYREALVAFLAGKDLCEDCLRRRETNPLRVLDCKRSDCRKARREAPASLDHLCDACARHRDGVLEGLGALRLPYRLDPSLVRGLDYYTRTVFEVVHDRLGAQDAVLGGGRYDGLVESLGGPPTPAVGFAAGLDRWASLLAAPPPRPPVLEVVPLTGLDALEAARVARWLRAASGNAFAVRLAFAPRPPGKAMRAADKAGVDFVLLIGEDERVKREARIKRLSDGRETTVALPDFESDVPSPPDLSALLA